MNTTLMLTLAIMGLSGCSNDSADGAFDSGGLLEGFDPRASLQLDVQPPGATGLLPQRRTLTPMEYGQFISFDLAPTVTISGALSAHVAYTWGANAPTKLQAIDATIQTLHAEVPAVTVLVDSEEGTDSTAWTLSAPAASGYTLAVVPTGATGPLYVQALDLRVSQSLTLELPGGYPVYGRVTGTDGAPVPSAPMRLVYDDGNSGASVRSAAFLTDSTGWFTTWVADPGDYRLETVAGPAGATLIPALSTDVSVGEEGAAADIQIGAPVSSGIIGKVVDDDGQPIADARVRIRSTRLDGCPGSYDLDSVTSPEGTFYLEALPGGYVLEIIPPYGRQDSPVRRDIVIGEVLSQLGSLALSAPQPLSGTITADGQPQAGVFLTATATDFGNYSYSTTTDSKGRYALNLPGGNYAIQLTPPAGSSWAITRRNQFTSTDAVLPFSSGTPIEGVLTDPAGEPVAFSLVEIKTVDETVLGRTISGEDGSFSMNVEIPVLFDEDDTGGNNTDTGGDTGGDTGSDTGGDTGGDTGSDTGGDTGGGSDTGR